jgi:hypothetical protein
VGVRPRNVAVPQPVEPLLTDPAVHALESEDPAAIHQPTKRCPPLAVLTSISWFTSEGFVNVLELAREYH